MGNSDSKPVVMEDKSSGKVEMNDGSSGLHFVEIIAQVWAFQCLSIIFLMAGSCGQMVHLPQVEVVKTPQRGMVGAADDGEQHIYFVYFMHFY